MADGKEIKFGEGISVIAADSSTPAKMVLNCRLAMFKENVRKFAEAFDAARKCLEEFDKKAEKE